MNVYGIHWYTLYVKYGCCTNTSVAVHDIPLEMATNQSQPIALLEPQLEQLKVWQGAVPLCHLAPYLDAPGCLSKMVVYTVPLNLMLYHFPYQKQDCMLVKFTSFGQYHSICLGNLDCLSNCSLVKFCFGVSPA